MATSNKSPRRYKTIYSTGWFQYYQKKIMNIAFLSVPFPGVRRIGEEGEKLNLWKFVLLEGNRIKIPSVDVCIFGAWHPLYSQLLGLRDKLGICWASSAGEMDMEPIEQEYLQRILQDPRISFVWFGDQSLASIYSEKGFYAPYPLNAEHKGTQSGKRDIATLFCPAGPKKNILNQLLAVKLVQREIKFTLHTNIEGYDGILKELDCVRHNWLPDDEYRNLLAQSKVNLAVSWSETFSYQVAESALCGTCSLVSETIPVPGIVITNPNSPIEIAEKIIWALERPVLGEEYRLKVIAFAQKCNNFLREKLAII